MDVFAAALKMMMVCPRLGEHEQAGRRIVMITTITSIAMLKDYPHPQYLKAALRDNRHHYHPVEKASLST